MLGRRVGIDGCRHQLSATAMMSPQMRVGGEVVREVFWVGGGVGCDVRRYWAGGLRRGAGFWLVASSIIATEPSAVTYTS